MDEIEQIKQKIDIVEFINQYTPLKKAGRNFKAICPFHQEKTPSFVVSPERQIWHCFGSCGEGGDIFTFLMKWENIEFYEALKILAKKAGVKLERSQFQSPKFKVKEKIYEINHLAGELYHYLLTSHKVGIKALDYLTARGIKKSLIKTFSLGYAPASWRTALPFLRKKGYAEEEMEKAGLVIKKRNGYYDRFRGRIVFTLKDHRGNVVGFSGRTLEKEMSGAKYINTPETLVYHKGDLLYGLDLAKKAIRDAKEVIVTEGEFDVISSFQAGIKNIVAIKGSALTENQVKVLKRFTENITLALDSDLAGDQATRRGIETADQNGLFVKVIELPKGEDADSLIKKDVDSWKKAVQSSIPVYDFFLNSAFNRLGGEKAQEKKQIAKELLPIWAKMTDAVVQAHYVKILAQRLKISEESIMRALAKLEKNSAMAGQPFGQKPGSKKTDAFFPTSGKSREEMLEEYFLALLLKLKKVKKFVNLCFEEDILEFFETSVIKKILKKLKKYFDEKDDFKIAIFAKELPKELIPMLDRVYLKNVEENFKTEGKKQKEIEKIFREIKKLFLRKQLKILAAKIKEEGIKEKFRKLSTQIKSLEKEK